MRYFRHIYVCLTALAAALLSVRCGDPADDGPGDPAAVTGGRIPAVYINTAGGAAVQRDDYIEATMRIYDPDRLFAKQADETFSIEIHGRGNSTWERFPKKPYKIKLAQKTRLLGMSDNKHWVLLANYSDKSMLRNALAFRLSKVAGMAWAPRWKPLELYLNGSYEGLYQLAEHIRVGEDRVELDVVEPSDNSGDALTGGYFLWIDGRSRSEAEQGVKYSAGFRTARGLPVTIEEPESPTTAQFDYIRNFITQTELDLYSLPYGELSKIIDIDSFVNYFFVHELGKNLDGNMRLSTYMWKPRGGKLGFPCVWDFDLAFGNCNYMPDLGTGNGPEGWYIRNAIWFRQLFRRQEFADRVKVMWNEFYPKLPAVEAGMREWAGRMERAQQHNFQKWPVLGVYVWPNLYPESRTTYQAEVDYMLGFFRDRADWMNAEITNGRHKKLD